ncbi:MAG: hypothetical protein OEV21_02860 [Thermoplasmata archaeon]|nr:hypothetical protein [Thermoplasmata archaeon]
MKKKTRKALKRRIPKTPGRSKCRYSFEVDGEIVLMRVDCTSSCPEDSVKKDICWSNLVKAIADSALPDRILLQGKRTVICDKVLVSLIRNASLLVRRINTRLDEMRRTGVSDENPEAKRLLDLGRAILYDIPQLISRSFKNESPSMRKTNGDTDGPNDKNREISSVENLLREKNAIDIESLGQNRLEKVSG